MQKRGKNGRSIDSPTQRCWRNDELRSLEEGLPQQGDEGLEKAARSYKATTGVGCDKFHHKDPVDLSKDTR